MARCTQGNDDNFVYFILDLNNNMHTHTHYNHVQQVAKYHSLRSLPERTGWGESVRGRESGSRRGVSEIE